MGLWIGANRKQSCSFRNVFEFIKTDFANRIPP